MLHQSRHRRCNHCIIAVLARSMCYHDAAFDDAEACHRSACSWRLTPDHCRVRRPRWTIPRIARRASSGDGRRRGPTRCPPGSARRSRRAQRWAELPSKRQRVRRRPSRVRAAANTSTGRGGDELESPQASAPCMRLLKRPSPSASTMFLESKVSRTVQVMCGDVCYALDCVSPVFTGQLEAAKTISHRSVTGGIKQTAGCLNGIPWASLPTRRGRTRATQPQAGCCQNRSEYPDYANKLFFTQLSQTLPVISCRSIGLVRHHDDRSRTSRCAQFRRCADLSFRTAEPP